MKQNKFKTKEELYSQFTRSGLRQFILDRDRYQPRIETAKELGVSKYTLRWAAKEVGIQTQQGRPKKDANNYFLPEQG